MGKNKLWFKIVIYIMIAVMFLSTIVFSLTWLFA